MHDLTREHAARQAQQAEPERHRAAALTRLLDHYRAWAVAAMDLTHPYARARQPEPPYRVRPDWTAAAANAWLDTELPNLLAAADAGHRLGLHRPTVDLAAIVHRRLIMRSRITDAVELQRLALRSAAELADSAAVARAHQDLGRALRHRHDFPAAARHLHRALDLAAAAGLTGVQVEAHIELAAVARYDGSRVDADEQLRQAYRLAQASGDELGQLEYHVTIARNRLNEGSYRDAAEHYDQTLLLARRTGYRAREIEALIGLGRADGELGRLTAAKNGFRKAVVLSREEGIPVGELAGLTNLAHAIRRSREPSTALAAYREALTAARRIGNQNWEYEVGLGIGRAWIDLGDGAAAVEQLEQTHDLARRLGVVADLARVEDVLGDARALLGELVAARRHWRTGADLLGELGVDHTDDPETTRSAIESKLAGAG